MNERIQELATQAKANVTTGLPVDEWIAEYNRIFAELIIRDCLGMFGKEHELEQKILERFGIDQNLEIR